MIIKTREKLFRVSDPAKIDEIVNVFRDPEFPEDYQFLGKNNAIKKGEIIAIFSENAPTVTKPEEKYYTVQLSYNDGNKDVVITAKDLAVAMWGFVKETKVVLSDGRAFRGKDIISILPNKVASMGWNDGYKLQPYDQEDIQKKLGRSLENYLSEVKNLIHTAPNLKALMEATQPLLEKFETKLLN
jgi:hypothetical protein